MKKTIAILAVLMIGSAMFAQSELTGSGATFPQPLYIKMFDQYLKTAKVKVNYQGVGSGTGIKNLIAKTVDFAGSDAPLTAAEATSAGADVLHIPVTAGAIVITYNIPGFSGKLNFTGELIADIFLGKITTWDDPAIKALNPSFKPDAKFNNIVVVRRSDSSGTSYNFTGYLSQVSAEWASKVGQNKSPAWPVGVGGKGNPGVASTIKQVPGSIGYVEIAFALENKMPVGLVKNKAGKFIDPSVLASVGNAANIVFPSDGKANIINSDAADGYPISAITWILLYKDQTYTNNQAKSKAVVDLIWWMIHDGQKMCAPNNYGALPSAAVTVAENLLKSVTYNGSSLIK